MQFQIFKFFIRNRSPVRKDHITQTVKPYLVKHYCLLHDTKGLETHSGHTRHLLVVFIQAHNRFIKHQEY
jgi:hypothetical protein